MAEVAPLGRRIAAEGVGAFFLFACVIGSGIMAQALSGGNDGVALLANTIATGAMLFVLITMLGPISGAHFNPAVTLIFGLKTLLFAVAVSLLPVANALRDIEHRPSRTSVELQGLVQMLVLMLGIEIASLVGNYY